MARTWACASACPFRSELGHPAGSPGQPPQLPLNPTGSAFGVRSETPSCHSGARFSSRNSGSRSSARKAICPSMRSRGAPRQWWTPCRRPGGGCCGGGCRCGRVRGTVGGPCWRRPAWPRCAVPAATSCLAARSRLSPPGKCAGWGRRSAGIPRRRGRSGPGSLAVCSSGRDAAAEPAGRCRSGRWWSRGRPPAGRSRCRTARPG